MLENVLTGRCLFFKVKVHMIKDRDDFMWMTKTETRGWLSARNSTSNWITHNKQAFFLSTIKKQPKIEIQVIYKESEVCFIGTQTLLRDRFLLISSYYLMDFNHVQMQHLVRGGATLNTNQYSCNDFFFSMLAASLEEFQSLSISLPVWSRPKCLIK